ncbi:MAG: hypothetical protein Q8922_15225 [Bacteroidota bacterium]|nr:hypothetical protein [Bacteroidota bacterium]MDP4234053.1 hypothetical protein [Bacteroidota bacterium]MDP4242919.1 hypothetical protein [Bacteroidota bacterium]MDP4289268.1 hypothetical protein [Bacteroidota bacterium]
MSLNIILSVIHLLAAVTGLGLITALALMARKPGWANAQFMLQMFKIVVWSMVIMLVTGVGMLAATGWVFEQTWWFRISFLFFIALFAFHGIASGTLKKIIASGTPLPSSPMLGKLRTMTMLMCVALILIVVLMEGKPF